MESLYVKDIFTKDVESIKDSENFNQIVNKVLKGKSAEYPVVDGGPVLLGEGDGQSGAVLDRTGVPDVDSPGHGHRGNCPDGNACNRHSDCRYMGVRRRLPGVELAASDRGLLFDNERDLRIGHAVVIAVYVVRP